MYTGCNPSLTYLNEECVKCESLPLRSISGECVCAEWNQLLAAAFVMNCHFHEAEDKYVITYVYICIYL
jgi:hypothetical protein